MWWRNFYARNKEKARRRKKLRGLEQQFAELTGTAPVGIAFENQLDISILQERLLLYDVSYDELYRTLRTAFKENSVAMLHSYQPIPAYQHCGRGADSERGAAADIDTDPSGQ